MGDREYKLPLIRTIEKHGRDLAHPYDIAQMLLDRKITIRFEESRPSAPHHVRSQFAQLGVMAPNHEMLRLRRLRLVCEH
jgi:hypothetical protein